MTKDKRTRDEQRRQGPNTQATKICRSHSRIFESIEEIKIHLKSFMNVSSYKTSHHSTYLIVFVGIFRAVVLAAVFRAIGLLLLLALGGTRAGPGLLPRVVIFDQASDRLIRELEQ